MSATDIDVLLVEDNDGDATLIERYLNSASIGLFYDEVGLVRESTLEAGIESFQSRYFDVVLLDLGLPGTTGIESLERVLEMDETVPIIVLTGLDDPETAEEAIHLGAQDFLKKGTLDSDRLVRALKYAIERHDQERELHRRTEQMEFFNSILRHDILNGINIITAESQLLAERLEGENAGRARKIFDWSEDITVLTKKIKAILDTITGDEERDLHYVRLRPLVEQEAEKARSIDEAVSVDVTVPADTAVRADDLLEDVVSNLLLNAVEHAGPGVAIQVDASRDANSVCLRVSDDAAPVSAQDREAIFDRGYKGAASGGTGFGLFFVASMVDSYGGSVDVESNDRGGSTFRVELAAAS